MDAHPAPTGRGRALPVTPAQIVAIGLVAASVGWAGWLLRERPAAERIDLLEDTVLTPSQLAAVEAALDRAQLTDYSTESGRVWVPRGRQSAYKRAIVDADALPKPWGTRFHDALAAGSVWASPGARAENLKVALQDELALVLGSMPGIERAAVMVDEEPQAGFRQEPLKTASIGIRTAAGATLDAVRAHGIRVLVASAIAGLDPERVAVTDLATGRVFAGPLPSDPSGVDPAMARRMAEESTLASRVKRALEFVPGVTVDVAIDDSPATAPSVAPPAPPSEDRTAAANAPAELLPTVPAADPRPVPPGRPAAPRDVRVTVAVPESYLAAAVDVARARRLRADADDEGSGALDERTETERIREIVLRAIAGLAAADRIGVLVTGYPTDMAMTSARTEAGEAGPSFTTAAPGDVSPATGGAPVLPREGWLAMTSVAVGLLAGFLWWAGSRDRSTTADEDWHRAGEDAAADAPPPRRMAA